MVRLQLPILLHAGGPTAASYPSAYWRSFCSELSICMLEVRLEGSSRSLLVSRFSSAVDTGAVDSGRRFDCGDSDWDVD